MAENKPDRLGPGFRTPKKLAILALILAGAAMPTPAYAEGDWSSSLGNVRNGFTSRTWYDGNRDGDSTAVRISGCSRSDGADFLLEVELRRQRTALPDVSRGRRNLSSCSGSTATGTWGDESEGTYFLQFWHYDFGTVSASSVNLHY